MASLVRWTRRSCKVQTPLSPQGSESISLRYFETRVQLLAGCLLALSETSRTYTKRRLSRRPTRPHQDRAKSRFQRVAY